MVVLLDLAANAGYVTHYSLTDSQSQITVPLSAVPQLRRFWRSSITAGGYSTFYTRVCDYMVVIVSSAVLLIVLYNILNRKFLNKWTRSIWKMLGPFATASRRTPHCHTPGVATVARRHCRMPPAHRCPRRRRRQRQRVTEGTAMAP